MLVFGFTLLGVAVFLAIFFYFAYHTFHGSLPSLFMIVVLVFVALGIISIGIDMFDVLEMIGLR